MANNTEKESLFQRMVLLKKEFTKTGKEFHMLILKYLELHKIMLNKTNNKEFKVKAILITKMFLIIIICSMTE